MLSALVITALISQAPPQAAASRLASVQVKGNSRYTPEEVSRLSGLEIGRAISVTDLGAAANRLAATGLFDTVKYTYSTGSAMTVVFDVVEAAWTVPVIFDNFAWFTDEQLTTLLRAQVPSFDGTAPLNAGAAEFMVRGLQSVLAARNLPGQVYFSAQQDMGKKAPRYLFAVKDPSPKVCRLQISGASSISEKELALPLEGVAGGDYSRFFLSTASRGTLTDMYRRKGYWRAVFDAPAAAVDACGVSVTLRVNEGLQYAWDGAEWQGNSVLAADALDKLLGMKSGDIADVSKIATGLRQVRKAYGARGRLGQAVTFEPKLDDASKRAAFVMKVDEGPEFRMGTISFEGIRESDAQSLAKKWPIKPGDVYDETLEDKFSRDVLFSLQTSAGGRGQILRQLDPGRQFVNVKIVFK